MLAGVGIRSTITAGTHGQVRVLVFAEEVELARRLVGETAPLMPSQAVVLREIVTHAFLANQTYDTTGRDGFLGV